MTRRNIFIALGVVLLGAAVVAANLWFKRDPGLAVTTEVIKSRDLEAIVSASGKIQPKRLVNVSAETAGRVVDLAVNEGDRITKGQFLLQIDPRNLRTRVDSGTASLQGAEASLDQMRQSIETARVQLEQARQNLKRQQDLWVRELTTREALEKAQNDAKGAESSLQEREKQIKMQDMRIAQERATLESARYDLTKVRMESPIDGIVTRRNIQQGETAVIGTMNNAGTVLLTLADMSGFDRRFRVSSGCADLVVRLPTVVAFASAGREAPPESAARSFRDRTGSCCRPSSTSHLGPPAPPRCALDTRPRLSTARPRHW